MNSPNLSTNVFTTLEDFQKVEKIVYDLFAGFNFTTLSSGITSYWIDQVSLKVNALSNQFFLKEKLFLQSLVSKAKQYSILRNLLINGNFGTLNAWTHSNNILLKSDNNLFKGQYIELPSTIHSNHPTYIYQKIEELKLKPYTRYYISGFIAQGHELELIISRYGKEIDEILNIPIEQSLPISTNPTSNCCLPNICLCSSCDGSIPDPHVFMYTIDVGQIQYIYQPGIQFSFRVSSPTGIGKLSNLEIVEGRSLTESEIQKIQRKEMKWLQTQNIEKEFMENLVKEIKTELKNIYPILNLSELAYFSYSEIMNMKNTFDNLLKFIPNISHSFIPNELNTNYQLYNIYKTAIDSLVQYVTSRNNIPNGNFTNALSNWNVHGSANIQIINQKPMLVLPQWDSYLTQTITLSDLTENQKYVLLITSQGTGKIIITYDIEDEIEIISLTSSNFSTTPYVFYPESTTFQIKIQPENTQFIIDDIELVFISEEIEE